MALLRVQHLQTHFHTPDGVLRAVDNVSFTLQRGGALGIVGESGSGKSVTALSLMRLIQGPAGRIVGGKVEYELTPGQLPTDLLTLTEAQMRRVRGKRIAMIFQEPMTSLNPVYTVGNQIGEAIALHEGGDAQHVRERSIEMLKLVGIPAPEKRVDDYPHQLSGGMRQRVMIAMALSCRPDVLIADEPTTALDVTVQAQILELLSELRTKLGMALILITHDFGIVAEMTEEVLVMYAGKVIEQGSTQELFEHPQHPYTQGLLRCALDAEGVAQLAAVERGTQRRKLATIPGVVPQLAHLPKGCSFADRCYKVQDDCRHTPIPDDPCHVGRLVRCIHV